ncbi:MAG: histidine kinase dimerization/phosphoacceptor domain -containing protein [Methanosarcinaceae archaeon]|nr:histidine kinase dimerization/phosphoacceptor domain -containing protein [Methanosarcinaceae archaeon]
MRFKDVSLRLKLILFIVLGISVVLITSMGVIISTVTSQEEELAYQQSVEMASNYANQFDADMKANQAIAKTIGTTMENYETSDREEVIGILESLLEKNPQLVGTYVCYEPDAFDGKDIEYAGTLYHDSTGRFVPYCNEIAGPMVVNPLKDYDISDYYQLPKTLKNDVLTEPYYYDGVFILSHVSPILRDGKFMGIGGVDVQLEYVDEEVSRVLAFDSGYAFIVSNTGIFLSHPTHKDWIGEKNLNDFGNKEFSKAAEEIKKGLSGHLETIDPTNGKTVVMFYEPVRTGNFAFVLVVPKEEMFAGVTALQKRLIVISAISILFMAALAFMIARTITRPIDEIVEGFRSIANDAVKGKLDIRADTDVEVDFREIPTGLNDILDVVIVPIRETIRVTNALAWGELKARVEVDVEGEFLELVDSLDRLSETLYAIIDDSNRVLKAFRQNDFEQKIQIQGQGAFRTLTNGIEDTRMTLGRVTAQRKEAEDSLLKYAAELGHSNERLKEMEQVINNSPVMIFLWKYENLWPADFVSENISRFGYSVEDFISGQVLYGNIIHPDDLEKVQSELTRNVENGSKDYTSEYRVLTREGDIRWVDERTFIQRDRLGHIRLQGIIFDITEHKKAEHALMRIEDIRKKEIHHRIKNNLQVISTLLYLESGNFEEEKVIEAFRDSQNRVKSMALVHEKLYQSEDMVSVDFADYLQTLGDYLIRSYTLGKDIHLKFNVDRVFLGMDTAVPLGIIINELFSNSLKHAFEGRENGEISICLRKGKVAGEKYEGCKKEECFTLVVRDNGTGFPESLDFRNTESLGLQLVTTLIDQINGIIELDTSKGTEFRIRFQELKSKSNC